MKNGELENFMVMPRYEIKPEYSCYCSKCEEGIQYGEKYWRLPWRSQTHEILCEKCVEEMTTYAKHNGVCCECGEDVREDDDIFYTEDGKFVCLSCIEEDSEEDWSVC